MTPSTTHHSLAASFVFALTGCAGVLGLDDYTDASGNGGAAATTGLAVSGSTSTTASTVSTGQTGSSAGGHGGTGGTDGSGGTGGDPTGPGDGGGGSTGSDGGGGSAPQCPGGSVCVPEAPAGWTGPAALYLGDSPPETCPAPWDETISANGGNVAGDHTCTPCACGTPSGAQCSVPQIRVWGNSSCTGASTLYSLQGNGTCVDTGGGYGARATESIPTDFGTCARSGGELTADPIQWDAAALVCGVSASPITCGADGICAPAAAPPLGERLCVYRDGLEAGCPLAYPERTVLHREANDTRACTSCTCALPNGVTCPDVIDASGNFNCGTPVYSVDTSGCDTSTYYASARFVNRPVGGSCSASGGMATGEVEPTLPMTVCCME